MSEAKPPLRPEEVKRVLGDPRSLIRGTDRLGLRIGTRRLERAAPWSQGDDPLGSGSRPLTGVVTFVDTDGIERHSDFIGAP